MKTFPLIILLALIFAFGCKKKEVNTKDLEIIKTDADNPIDCKLSSIFEKGELIKLETSDTCLIDYVAQLVKSDDYLFLCDGFARVLQFDSSGKFIRQVGRQGKGPQEYIRIIRIFVDEANDCLIINSRQKFLWFDFNGGFIKSETLASKGEVLEYTGMADGYLYMVKTSITNKSAVDPNKPDLATKARTMIYKYGNNFQLVDSILFRDVVYPLGFTYNQWPYYISNVESGLYFYYSTRAREPLLRDTLFRIENSNIVPVLKIDFSDVFKSKNVTSDQLIAAMSAKDDGSRYLKLINDVRNVTINNVYRTENYVFVEYEYQSINNFFWYCYDRSKGKGYTAHTGFVDDLFKTDSLATVRPLDLSNNLFYFYKEGWEIKGIIDSISENSNPVLFMLNTKE